MGTQTAIEGNVAATEPKEKRKTSATYTVKAFGDNIKKLQELGAMDEADAKTAKEIHLKLAMKLLGV